MFFSFLMPDPWIRGKGLDSNRLTALDLVVRMDDRPLLDLRGRVKFPTGGESPRMSNTLTDPVKFRGRQ
jgi:hypothetical protein